SCRPHVWARRITGTTPAGPIRLRSSNDADFTGKVWQDRICEMTFLCVWVEPSISLILTLGQGIFRVSRAVSGPGFSIWIGGFRLSR
ncbi:hypothetical protein, partial [Gordonia desulfuricans]|uniref:hypothetical protein n=1 Tax=Gordonia desulfuricans TaxID=89051 RepID=UPI001EE48EBE